MGVNCLSSYLSGIIVRKNNNIIEINGQRYDAKTGALLTPSSPKHGKAKPVQPVAAASQHTKPAMHTDVIRRPGKRPALHSPKASRTLMRQAVKKPDPSLKRHLKVQGHTDTLAQPPLAIVAPAHSVQQLDAKRLQKASQVAKSRLISHFLPPAASTASRPAALAPAQSHPEASLPVAVKALAGQDHSAKLGKRPKTTADILARAIEQATSHEELPPPRHSRAKRNVAIGGVVGLSVLLLGVIVTQNLSNVRLQMASARAGFSASLPDYHPAGYSLGQLDYSDGVVAANFHSNSDGQLYSITQKRSAWDSATLLNTFVAPADPNYQTTEAAGRTIYIYGDANATWVNGGVWYVIQSNGSLNDRQLVDLATSL